MLTATVKNELIKKYDNEDFVLDKSGCKVVEIINCNFEADKPYLLRPPNKEYIQKELNWYVSESLNVHDMQPPIPSIWLSVASADGSINSNYGWSVFNEANNHQYDNVYKALCDDLKTRRAIMIYTRPSMHDDFNAKGMNDFTCTNTVQYLYRDGAVHAIVNMRSNDAVFGYTNDVAWQHWVLDKLVDDLNKRYAAKIRKGKIYWNAGSMHVYERHFDLLGENYESNS